MKALILHILFILLLAGAASDLKAQLSGTITIPGSAYPNLASVVTALNTQGVGSGGVTINLTTGNPQTAPAGGYRLGSAILNNSVAAANAITINGNGNTVTAFAGTGTADGIFIVSGTDYLTIDSLNLLESTANTTATTQMEWGYALLKRSTVAPYDGCQHVSIRNCSVSLGAAGDSSIAIYAANHTDAGTGNIVMTGGTAADAHSHNSFSGNKIVGCLYGIYLRSADNPDARDYNTSIGLPKGNHITYGGNGAKFSAGILSLYDSTFTIRNNSLYISPAHNPLAFGSAVSGVYLSHSLGRVAVSGNYFDLNTNMGSVFTRACWLFEGSDSTGVLTFSDNELSGSNTNAAGSSEAFLGIACQNVAYDSISIRNNIIHDVSWGGYGPSTGSWRGFVIRTGNAVRPIKTVISGNTVRDVQLSYWTAYPFSFFDQGNITTPTYLQCSGNKVQNVRTALQGAFFGFEYTVDTGYSTGNKIEAVYSVSLVTGFDLGPSTVMFLLRDTVVHSRSGRIFRGVDGLAPHCDVANMYIASDTAGIGVMIGIRGGDTISGNLITGLVSLSATHTIAGLENPGIAYNNIISDLQAPLHNGSNLYGMLIDYSGLFGGNKIYNNTIHLNPVDTAAGFGAIGIRYAAGALIDLRNNIIHVDATPSGQGIVAALSRETGVAGTDPYNFSDSSDGNIYYAPNAPNCYLYGEGADAASLVNGFNLNNDPNFNTGCSAFKTFVRHEYHSRTEDNLIAASVPGVYIPSGASYAESGVVSTTLLSIPKDFDGQSRSTPADIGALEFNGTAPAPWEVTTTPGADLSFCSGDSVTLFAPAGNGFSYQWLKNGAAIGGATDSAYTAHVAGIYAVAVSGTSCADTSSGDTLVVHPLPVATITLSGLTLQTGTFASYQWYLNGQAISGATAATYTALANGDYYVVVTDGNGCSNKSNTLTVTNVGVQSLPGGWQYLTLFPNPGDGRFTIRAGFASPLASICRISIVDAVGRTAEEHSVPVSGNKLQHVVDISGRFAPGLYLVRVAVNGQQATIPFVLK